MASPTRAAPARPRAAFPGREDGREEETAPANDDAAVPAPSGGPGGGEPTAPRETTPAAGGGVGGGRSTPSPARPGLSAKTGPAGIESARSRPPRIAAVVPAYRCSRQIEAVVRRIGPEVADIVVVDDACPEGTGRRVEALIGADPAFDRVVVLRQEKNTGVGGAALRGMTHARKNGADILVKIDGDGQMAPELLPRFVSPIVAGAADYAKGNRFHAYRLLREMPLPRLVGNGVLSFITKASSGYWNVFDPTNGYVAIAGAVFDELPVARLERRYFFETDLLCELGLLRAAVTDIPMRASYGDETSGLSPIRHILPFFRRHLARLLRRVFYGYFLRDFSVGSLYLLTGLPLLGFGVVFGTRRWIEVQAADITATAGTVMLAALPVILGVVLLLNFVSVDVLMTPREPIHPKLGRTPPGNGPAPAGSRS